MAYKVQYLPVTGPLPGKSFENQTAAFLSEIGTLAENATGSGSEAITAAQEARTAAQAAQTTSADAKTTADAARNAVKSATDKADSALSSATSAVDTAADAKSAATAADAKSAAALSVAQAAQTTADAAESSANTAINNSVNAQTAAANAQTAAATAQTMAENAQTAAQTAQTTADTVKGTADTAINNSANAQTEAANAQTAAATAQTAAQTAQTTADAVKGTADATAAGLKSFMDTAGHPLGLATLDGDGKLVETAALADRALTAEGLSEILSAANGGTGAADIINAAKNLRFVRYGDWRSEWNNNADLVSESCVLRCQFTLGIPDGHNFGQLLTVYDGSTDTKSQIYFGLSHAGYYVRSCVGSNWEDWKRLFSNTDVIPAANGGTGNAEGQAASADVVKWGGNKQSSVPSDGGLSYCTIWGANDPGIAENCGVPVAGVGSSLLSMHKENIDGIGNDITAQLFFSNDNELWLRTNAHSQNIQKSSPWIPMLTAINGFAASAFSTAQAFSDVEELTLPAGGSWFYFLLEGRYLDQSYSQSTLGGAEVGVVSGGTRISNSNMAPFCGFYMKIA